MMELVKSPVRMNMTYDPPVVHHYQPTHIVVDKLTEGRFGKLRVSLFPVAKDGLVKDMLYEIELPITQAIAWIWHRYLTEAVKEIEYQELVKYVYEQLRINPNFIYSVK